MSMVKHSMKGPSIEKRVWVCSTYVLSIYRQFMIEIDISDRLLELILISGLH